MFERRLWPRSAQCKSLASFKYSSIFDNGGQVCRPASQINRLDSRCVGALGKEEWFPNTPGGVGAASPRAPRVKGDDILVVSFSARKTPGHGPMVAGERARMLREGA